jgi:hypothetical protein
VSIVKLAGTILAYLPYYDLSVKIAAGKNIGSHVEEPHVCHHAVVLLEERPGSGVFVQYPDAALLQAIANIDRVDGNLGKELLLVVGLDHCYRLHLSMSQGDVSHGITSSHARSHAWTHGLLEQISTPDMQ